MRLGKLAAAAPLAMLTGAGIHLAVAGFDHAPGGAEAPALLGILVATLALALGGALLAGMFGAPRLLIATRQAAAYQTLGLALAGIVAFVLAESLEGNLAAGRLVPAVAAALPVAALVLAVAGRLASALREAGSRLRCEASAARSRALGRVPAIRRRTPFGGIRRRTTTRGRAPPLFA
jgi:hypothetical protein